MILTQMTLINYPPMQASGKDDNVILSPIRAFTLEQAISFIREDELV